MLVLLMATLTGEKSSMYLCCKNVCDLKAEYLHDVLIAFLKKSKECDFDVLSIIMDGASTHVKVARKLLKELSKRTNAKLIPFLS